MARTILEIPTQNKNLDQVGYIITSILMRYGYQNKIVKGENMWIKGDGIIMKMGCFSYFFTENTVVIQSWMKDALTGESDLTGFVAAVPKKKMMRILDEIRGNIMSC